MPNPYDYLWDDVVRTRRGFEDMLNAIGSSPAKAMRAALHAVNDKVNGSYPIAHEFMARSIDGKGNITYKAGSKVSDAILASAEFRKMIGKKREGFCFGRTAIGFRSDANLARSIHDGTFWGELTPDGKGWSFDGELSDTYDFRFDLIPKTMTVRGFALRQAGNIAYACQEMGLMSNYKVSVVLKGKGRF